MATPSAELLDIASAEEMVLKKTTERRPNAEILPRQCLVNIVDGDAVLNAGTNTAAETVLFRVSSQQLRSRSPYFELLLGSPYFAEGARLLKVHNELLKLNISPSVAPADSLPQVNIVDICQVSDRRDQDATGDLLRILHDQDITCVRPGVGYAARLAILADKWTCLPAVRSYVRTKGVLRKIDAKSKVNGRCDEHCSEERLRQKFLSGWLLECPAWVLSSSHLLIIRGSSRWLGNDTDETEKQDPWWDLPDDVERKSPTVTYRYIEGKLYAHISQGELLFRRESIIKTLNSLQTHLINRYTSKDRQCSLGYDSSPQCDSFQLGEAIRFLTRVGTLHLQGLVCDPRLPERCSLSITDIILKLRQCPEYQLNRHHAHCGIRAKLLPALELIQTILNHGVGVCKTWWEDEKAVDYKWSKTEAPARWVMPTTNLHGRIIAGAVLTPRELTCYSKAFFTASTKVWAPVTSQDEADSAFIAISGCGSTEHKPLSIEVA